MDSGFEALPARVSRANGRKRRVVTLSSSASAPSASSAAAPAVRASHAYNVITDAAAVSAEEASSPVLYDSAASESADVDAHSQPGGVEGSGGLGKWEYLDHTADVQVHTCAWGLRSGSLALSSFRVFTPTPHLSRAPLQGATLSRRPSRSRRSACGRT